MKHPSIAQVVLIAAITLAAPLFGQQQSEKTLRHGAITPEEIRSLVELSNSSPAKPDAPPPLWMHSSMASRDGHVYTSVSIGSSPYADVKTTTNIPVVIVPLVVTVDGVTLDPTAAVTNSCVRPDWNGQTPVQVLLQSPIFKATAWTMNGQDVGTGQYVDAFQRAQYWSLVEGSNYHTVLNPTVAAAQTVPAAAIDPQAAAATSACVAQSGGAPDQIVLGPSDTGLLTPWIEGTLIPQLTSQGVIDSGQLVYFLLYNTTFSDAYGFHSYVGTQTYAVSLINGSDCCSPDVKTISHVVAEWMNDPLPAETQNRTPGWEAQASAAGRSTCQGNSSVGDPTSSDLFPSVTMPNGLTYHPQELTFSSWFRGAPSIGAGGLYSNNSSLTVDAGAVCDLASAAPLLTITTTSLANGVAGNSYSQALTATGGTPPYTWSVAGGRLPSGLALNPATGLISGTPTNQAGSLVTFQVTDSGNPAQTATEALTITISPSPAVALQIATFSLSNGSVGAPYLQTLIATGGTTPYTWQLAGTLPAGLTFNTSTGVLSGTPSVAVTATPLAFKVTDSSTPPQTATVTLSLTVTPPPIIFPFEPVINCTLGTLCTFGLTGTGGTPPYTWQLVAGTLPAGLSLSPSTGVVSGTPTVTVTNLSLTFKLTDSGTPPQTATATLLLTISPGSVTITTTALLSGVVGQPYTFPLMATGGTAPYTWSLNSGTLPPGLTLNPATGVISGAPTAPVPATPLTFKVTDSGSPQVTAISGVLSLTILPLLTITTPALPNGIVGTPYLFTLTAAGGAPSYAWSLISGTLPAGLTLNSVTGVISGTPSAPASATLTFKVTDSGTPQQTATSPAFTLTIVPPLTLTTAALPNGIAGQPYTFQLVAAGGTLPYTWVLNSGTLPAGLTLNPVTGVISGTPAGAVTATPLTFKVTDSGSPQQSVTSGNLPLTILPLLMITTTALPSGQVGSPYLFALAATGGVPSYTWSLIAGTLPAGLALNPATGVISGTPSAPASATPLTVKVTDSGTPQQSATTAPPLTLTIIPPTLVITTAALPNGVVNSPYTFALTATGGALPYTWVLNSGTLPNGLTLNPATGVISGTPTSAVTATPLSFKVTDSSSPQQTATSANLPLTIIPLLTITTTALPSGQVGSPYLFALAATGGVPSYTWSLIAGTLPAGLTLNPTTGVISGTPSAAASATPLTFKVTDSGTPQQSATTTPPLTLTIISPLVITTTALPNGVVNSPYTFALTATGGTLPYAWVLNAGTLPNGLTLNPATGVISGTPIAAVSATPLTFKVTDSSSPQQTATLGPLPLTIIPLLTITTTALPSGQVGTPYLFALAATGGVPSYTWSLIAGTLPAGLTLNPTTGVISGTPSAAASATPLTFKVTDSGTPQQSATTTPPLTLTIISPLVITTAALPNGVVNSPYTFALTATGGTLPYAWVLNSGTLPAGLTLNPATGAISGIPTAAVTATPLTFKVTDSTSPQQSVISGNLPLTIIPLLTITTTALPSGQVGSPYVFALAATGGVPSDTWSLIAGTLPAGLTLNPTTGVISGTPSAAASATLLTFKVTDSGTPQQSATTAPPLTLTVVSAPLTITTTSLVPGTVGAPYSQTLTATGGTPPYTWSLIAGRLPGGLSLNTATGVISGTPSDAVPGSLLTFQVTDTSAPQQSVTAIFLITIGSTQ